MDAFAAAAAASAVAASAAETAALLRIADAQVRLCQAELLLQACWQLKTNMFATVLPESAVAVVAAATTLEHAKGTPSVVVAMFDQVPPESVRAALLLLATKILFLETYLMPVLRLRHDVVRGMHAV
jgi:hypothetical protein